MVTANQNSKQLMCFAFDERQRQNGVLVTAHLLDKQSVTAVCPWNFSANVSIALRRFLYNHGNSCPL